jgi:transposase
VISTEQVRAQLADLERFVQEEYKPRHPPKKRDWRTYEEQWAYRIRQVMRDLGPLVHEACAFARLRGPGPEPVLTLEQRVTLLLLKVLYEQSNRRMAGMLVTFSLLSGLDVSYKTVERLYSDPEVAVALNNLHTRMLRRRGVRVADVTGDGTGFALSITQHYATTATKEKESAKENPPSPGPIPEEKESASAKKVRRYVYSFRLLDLRTWLYVAYGTSARSERGAYETALAWLKVQGIEVASVRLDRYYSHPSDAARFRGAKFYMLPRKDVKVHIQHEWLEALREFVERPLSYLEQYYRREHSEAAFGADKRMLGWRIAQRREDRIEMADRCHSSWHNLLNVYGPDRTLSGGPLG